MRKLPSCVNVEGTATVTEERFFAFLAENLAKALGTDEAWVAEFLLPGSAIGPVTHPAR